MTNINTYLSSIFYLVVNAFFLFVILITISSWRKDKEMHIIFLVIFSITGLILTIISQLEKKESGLDEKEYNDSKIMFYSIFTINTIAFLIYIITTSIIKTKSIKLEGAPGGTNV